MGARRFEDLIAWQLAHELQEKITEISARRNVASDRNFCDQIKDSTRSATRNIAEGFGKFQPREFRPFLNTAAGSLQETRNHLVDAHDRGYISGDELQALTRLALRALKATLRLAKYLKAAPPR